MSDRRDVGRMAEQMRAALDQYSKEDLMDLLTHIVRVYVIEGQSGGVSHEQGGQGVGMNQLAGLSFAQLVLHLQMNLPQEELGRLHVSGDRVWVESGGQEIALTQEPEPELPPDPEVIDDGPARRVPAQEAFGERGAMGAGAPGVRAVTGPVRPVMSQEVSRPSPGTPRPRTEPRRDARAISQRAASIERPGVGLRNQPQEAAPRVPPAVTREQRDWLSDMGPGRRGGRQPEPEPVRPSRKDDDEDVGDVSDRFSMLELD